MGYHEQGINNPLSEQRSFVNNGGLQASPFTGVVNDAVLLFAAGGTQVGPTGDIVVANDANDGTSVTLNKSGIYEVKLYLEQLAATVLEYGISEDVAAAGLVNDPDFSILGMLEVGNNTTIAGQLQPIELVTTVLVSPEEEGGAGKVVRFHATDGANGAPALRFTQAACYYSVRRVNQLHA